MKIGIIGAGRVGGTLGKAWARLGHEVMFGVRDPGSEKVQGLLKEAGPAARAGSIAEAAAFGEVVVLAVPWAAAQDAARAAGDLRGKILIDVTNTLTRKVPALALGPETSSAEEIARRAVGAKVVKAFNTIGAVTMANPKYGTLRADTYICGDDEAAKATVTGLAKELGFDVVDVGPLTSARLVEALTGLWAVLAFDRGLGPSIAFKLLRR